MRRGDLDRSQRFRVEPVIPVAKAKAANRPHFAVNDGELKLAIERGRFDVLPSRGVEKSG